MNSRLPLPLSVSRAQMRVALSTALLAAACCFGAGFVVALYTIGLIVTRP